MKQVLIIVLAIAFYTCSGSKNAIESESEKTEHNTIQKTKDKETFNIITSAEEAPQIIKSIDSLKTLSKGDFKIAVKKTKTFDEKKINDSIYFIQILKHDKWDKLLKKHVSKSGEVNYLNFKNDYTQLKEYINYLTVNEQKKGFTKNNKLAYWINAYNALTIDLILRHYPLKSIKDIKDPWDQRLWQFGDKWLNLNDIEHKILRKMNEPRIHFAIVCASESCPKLLNKAFTANNLEEQLTTATKAFLSDTSKNEISENSIKLSKIFKWFAKDFKTEGRLIDFLNQYSEVTISENAKKSYKDYDWSLND